MQNALSALEKFSIKRKGQNVMLKFNIIEWTVKVLRNPGILKEYTLDYITALLMNLALRTEGKRKCEEPEIGILDVLKPLMEHTNPQIRSHINGTLYSLFTTQVIKERAKVKYKKFTM